MMADRDREEERSSSAGRRLGSLSDLSPVRSRTAVRPPARSIASWRGNRGEADRTHGLCSTAAPESKGSERRGTVVDRGAHQARADRDASAQLSRMLQAPQHTSHAANEHDCAYFSVSDAQFSEIWITFAQEVKRSLAFGRHNLEPAAGIHYAAKCPILMSSATLRSRHLCFTAPSERCRSDCGFHTRDPTVLSVIHLLALFHHANVAVPPDSNNPSLA